MKTADGAAPVLIDASNLQSGGGLQVASSFIDELSALVEDESSVNSYPWVRRLVVHASGPVIENLTRSSETLLLRKVDRFGARAKSLRAPSQHFGVSFTIFGPEYSRRRAVRRINGFADGTSLFDTVGASTRFRDRALQSARRNISRVLFSRQDLLVVEADHVKAALVARWHLTPSRIVVVPNTLNDVFRRVGSTPTSVHLNSEGALRICYVTRSYPHKNIELLGRVGELLESKYGIPVRFILTLREDEWALLSPLTRRHSINVGPLPVAALPSLYSQCDFSIFPSLVESFSVTPLEALACGVPLLASDRPFVRDVCGPAATYFDPLDPADTAHRVATLSRNDTSLRLQVDEGKRLIEQWPTARDRALSYLSLIDGELKRLAPLTQSTRSLPLGGVR